MLGSWRLASATISLCSLYEADLAATETHEIGCGVPMPTVGHVPCLRFYCQRSATAASRYWAFSDGHRTGFRGYLRTYAVDTEISVGSVESMIATWHALSSVLPRTLRLGPVVEWEN